MADQTPIAAVNSAGPWGSVAAGSMITQPRPGGPAGCTTSSWLKRSRCSLAKAAAPKRIAGWKLSSSLATPLVQEAFERAVKLWSVCPALHHSDRGVQYASSAFRELLNSYQVTPSMSRKACCYDNAAMESFWATLKTECFHDQIPLNLKHAQAMLFDYIETFYNPTRLHSSLGYLSPIEFENSLSFPTKRPTI